MQWLAVALFHNAFQCNCRHWQGWFGKDLEWKQAIYLGKVVLAGFKRPRLEYLQEWRICISPRQFSVTIISCNWVFDGNWIVQAYIFWQKPGVQKIYRARLKVLSSHGAYGECGWLYRMKVEKFKQEIGLNACSFHWCPEGSRDCMRAFPWWYGMASFSST